MRMDAYHKVGEPGGAEIVARYLNGQSQTAIAETLGIDRAAVRYHLRKRRVAIRAQGEACRKRSLNQAAFDVLTPEAAYWTGFLMADGCIRLRKGRPWAIALVLAPKDRLHLEAFRSFLGSTHAIIPNSHKPSPLGGCIGLRFSVSSFRLAARLADLGVTARKTYTAGAKGGLEFDRHFWRGVFDGDGCVRWSHPRGVQAPEIRIAGALPLIAQFQEFCKTLCPQLRVNLRPQKMIWSFHAGGSTAARIVRGLYQGCSVALPRKLTVAQEIMSRAIEGVGQ